MMKSYGNIDDEKEEAAFGDALGDNAAFEEESALEENSIDEVINVDFDKLSYGYLLLLVGQEEAAAFKGETAFGKEILSYGYLLLLVGQEEAAAFKGEKKQHLKKKTAFGKEIAGGEEQQQPLRYICTVGRVIILVTYILILFGFSNELIAALRDE
eukprot:68509_1